MDKDGYDDIREAFKRGAIFGMRFASLSAAERKQWDGDAVESFIDELKARPTVAILSK